MEEAVIKKMKDRYFQGIADDIANAKIISSIFPNMSDVGDIREGILLSFLQKHLPTRCNVFKGGTYSLFN